MNTQEKLYADIRKKNAEQILEDGHYWWATSGGIPSRRFPTKEIPALVEHLEKTFKERGPPPNPVGLTHILSGKMYDWEEMKVLAKTLKEVSE